MSYEYKVHLRDQPSRSGARRSVCGQVLLDGPWRNTKAKWTTKHEEVSCKPCRESLQRTLDKQKNPRPIARVYFDENCLPCLRNRNCTAPPHEASARCESGKSSHCSCNRCF